jgi:hypothetical protein
MVAERIAQEVQGIIACANERGLKLDGEAERRNVSRFAAAATEIIIGGTVDKDTKITRMNVLGHAIDILASSGPVDVADVLRVAAELEAWVCRS